MAQHNKFSLFRLIFSDASAKPKDKEVSQSTNARFFCNKFICERNESVMHRQTGPLQGAERVGSASCSQEPAELFA